MKKTFNILMPILMMVEIYTVFNTVFTSTIFFDEYRLIPIPSNLVVPMFKIFLLILPISVFGIIINKIWLKKNKISKKSAEVAILCNWLCIMAFFATIYTFIWTLGHM